MKKKNKIVVFHNHCLVHWNHTTTKISKVICCLLITLAGQSQTINGTYKALELNGLKIDTTGFVYFYGQDSFSTQKHFHEVEITIQGTKITVEKLPVYFENTNKVYSESDGGFLTYKGTLVRNGDVYFAKTQLTDCDYIGMTYFTPPKITDDNDITVLNRKNSNTLSTEKEVKIEKLEKFKSINGIIYLPKGTIRKDIIIRPAKKGIWVNNQLFYPIMKSQITIPKS